MAITLPIASQPLMPAIIFRFHAAISTRAVFTLFLECLFSARLSSWLFAVVMSRHYAIDFAPAVTAAAIVSAFASAFRQTPAGRQPYGAGCPPRCRLITPAAAIIISHIFSHADTAWPHAAIAAFMRPASHIEIYG
jgi:hypothetical protein